MAHAATTAPRSDELAYDLPPIATPEAPTVYIQNKRNQWFIIESGEPGDEHRKAVPPLVLSPLWQGPLVSADFWTSHAGLRGFTDAPADNQGQDMPLRIFARKVAYAIPKPIPPAKQCKDEYMTNVQQICFGPLELPGDMGGAIDEIMLAPQVGNPPRVDVKFLVHQWRLVLESALHVLTEHRRTGHEVDSRRIELLTTRLATIEEYRLEYGIPRKTSS